MGSQVDARDEITVLVTGFGPFRANYPVNPSWEIASRLPAHLPPLRAKDPGARPSADAVDLPSVRIMVHPEPVRVNYKTVRELVPTLWDGSSSNDRKPDIVIHMGMAGPRPMWQIERRGHRMGYRSPDVDDEKLEDEFGDDATRHGRDWVWYGLPDELETELDMPDILSRWKQYSPKDLDLLISDDAGRYLCDFIYFSSLAHLWKQQRPRKVLFFHVPSDASDEAVAKGLDLAVNLIRSIVESEVAARKKGDGSKEETV